MIVEALSQAGLTFGRLLMAIAVVGIVVAVLGARDCRRLCHSYRCSVRRQFIPNAISNRPRSPDAWYGNANTSSLPDHCPDPRTRNAKFGADSIGCTLIRTVLRGGIFHHPRSP